MNTDLSPTGLQLRSSVSADGQLEIVLVDVDTPAPAADEVVVRVEATPINPSDIGLLFSAADFFRPWWYLVNQSVPSDRGWSAIAKVWLFVSNASNLFTLGKGGGLASDVMNARVPS